MKEFDFIRNLKTALPANVPLGIGDDAALVRGTLLAKDLMVEGVHFLPTSAVDRVLMKLFTANVSDIAAMGGVAEAALLGISAPAGRLDEELVLKGLQRATAMYNIPLVGGDTTSSTGGLFLSLTVTGRPGPKLLTRSGALPGDIVCLSRPTGLSRLSLEVELGTHTHPISPKQHFSVMAEAQLGALLSHLDGISSCIDISDGLGKDASHIAEESGFQVQIDSRLLPVVHLTQFNINAQEYALTSGEEYALLFTVRPESIKLVMRQIKEHLGRSVWAIGMVTEGEGATLRMPDGSLVDIANRGWEHTV